MSEFITFTEIVYKDPALIKDALARLGFNEIEEGENLRLYGFRGDLRDNVADIVVRRKHLGKLSNDLGFARTQDGYVPVISNYDRRALFGGQFLHKFKVAYQQATIAELARRLGAQTEVQRNGHVTTTVLVI
jgi:hypothetical protein